MIQDEWLTTSEAAQLSGYHVERIRELIREGRINARKFGPVWAVNRKSLLSYLQQMSQIGDKRGPVPKSQ